MDPFEQKQNMVKENHGLLQLQKLNQDVKKLDSCLLEDEIIYGQVSNNKKIQTYEGRKCKWTGYHINVQKIKDLVVLDFDLFNLQKLDEQSQSLENKFLKIMQSSKFYVERTASKGFHVYLFNDYFNTKKSRRIDAKIDYTGKEEFKMDIFYSIEGGQYLNQVSATGSQIYSSKLQQINTIESIVDDEEYYDGLYLKASVFLKLMGIKVLQQEKEQEEETQQDLEIDDKQAFIKDVVGCNQHTESKQIWQTIVINSTKILRNEVDEEVINEILEPLFRKQQRKQDQKSTEYWVDQYYDQYAEYNEVMSYNILRKLLTPKLQKQYPCVNIKVQIENPTLLTINILDPITLMDLADNHNKSLQDIIDMMKQVIGYSRNENLYFIKRMGVDRKPTISYLQRPTLRDYLSPIKTNEQIGKKSIWNLFEENEEMFQYNEILFYTKDKYLNFSLFNWWCQSIHDNTKIQQFLDHILNIICDGDKKIFDYVQNWISFIVQNPGMKNQSAIVLQSKQGTGKNMFTDRICDMFGGLFTNSNANGLRNITGQFNSLLINKMLVIVNEATNSENRHEDMQCLKQLITEKQIEANAKNQQQRIVQNVSNFIVLSNNVMPVKLEESDRRYLVLKVNESKIGNKQYFEDLIQSTQQDGFYEALRNYYENRNIKNFKSQDIPQTEAKQELLQISESPATTFIKQKIPYINKDGIERKFLIEEYKSYCIQESIKCGPIKYTEIEWKQYLKLVDTKKQGSVPTYYLK